MQGGPGLGPGLAGQDIHPGHGGNSRQGLPPEAQGADGSQVPGGAQLAGGMAQKRRGQLLGRDAAAVVRHPQIGQAPVLHLCHDGGSPGVQGVFQQLLGHAGGPLHHLAGGDQVGYMRR